MPRVYWFLLIHLVLSGALVAAALATDQMAFAVVYMAALLFLPVVWVAREGGKAAVAELYKRSLPGKHPRGIWFATLLPAAFLMAAMALYSAIASTEEITFAITLAPGLLGVLFGVWMEEVSWRGYALPKLLERHTAIGTSLILGSFWSLWHLPVFFMEGYSPAGPVGWFALLPFYFSFSFFATWLGMRSRFNILLPTLAHFFVNWFVTWYEPTWMEYVATIGSGILLGATIPILFKGLEGRPAPS